MIFEILANLKIITLETINIKKLPGSVTIGTNKSILALARKLTSQFGIFSLELQILWHFKN